MLKKINFLENFVNFASKWSKNFFAKFRKSRFFYFIFFLNFQKICYKTFGADFLIYYISCYNNIRKVRNIIKEMLEIYQKNQIIYFTIKKNLF